MEDPKDRKSPKDLPGNIWGVTTFFNPANYKIKKPNYSKFRDGLQRQGLKLLTVECVFGEQPFSLSKNDADILIQRRASSVMWQKERLLNIGFENLPDDCDKVVFLDADIIFENNDWVIQTGELLNSYKVVQPYDKVLRLPKGGLAQIKTEPRPGKLEMEQQNSMAYNMLKLGNTPQTPSVDYGHTGFAWALRRELLEGCGIYDTQMGGEGDIVLAYSFYGITDYWLRNNSNKNVVNDMDIWSNEMYLRVNGSVSYTKGRILHLWHGNQNNRHYHVLTKKLDSLSFDPRKDLKIDENGCWQWASNNIKLQQETQSYFSIRQEDGSRITSALNLPWRRTYAEGLFEETYWSHNNGKIFEALGTSIYGILIAPIPIKLKFFRILLKSLFGRNLTEKMKSFRKNFQRNVRGRSE